jgi:hypothetical protein
MKYKNTKINLIFLSGSVVYVKSKLNYIRLVKYPLVISKFVYVSLFSFQSHDFDGKQFSIFERFSVENREILFASDKMTSEQFF